MELNVVATNVERTSTVSSASIDNVFVQHQLESVVIIVCVASVILIFVIMWLIYKLCCCGEMKSSSRSSSQSSLCSNTSSDSPYQWKSLSIEVPNQRERGIVYTVAQNKTIQRLLDIRSENLKKEVQDTEPLEEASMERFM